MLVARLRRLFLVLVLMLAATSVASATLVACKGEKAEEKKAAIEVFEGDKPTWPAEVADGKLGQKVEDWVAAGVFEKGKTSLKSAKYKGVAYEARTEYDSIESLSVTFKHNGDIVEELTKKWGDPVPLLARMADTGDVAWLNPEEGIRARVDPSTEKYIWVDYEPYMTVSALFEGAPGTLVFEEGVSLLGKTGQEIVEAFPETYFVSQGARPNEGRFRLPALEFDRERLTVSPSFGDDGLMSSYNFTVRVPDAQKAAVVELIQSKLGEPRMGKTYNGEIKLYYLLDKKVRVQVDDAGKNTIDVRVERFIPVEELFAKDKLVFEGEKSWLGSMSKDQWSKLKGLNSSGTWLVLPPTDFEYGWTNVAPTFEGDVLKGYSFSLGSSLVPNSRDEVLERIKKTLGEPTVGQTGYANLTTYAFQTNPPIVFEESYGGDGWTVRVGQ